MAQARAALPPPCSGSAPSPRSPTPSRAPPGHTPTLPDSFSPSSSAGMQHGGGGAGGGHRPTSPGELRARRCARVVWRALPLWSLGAEERGAVPSQAEQHRTCCCTVAPDGIKYGAHVGRPETCPRQSHQTAESRGASSYLQGRAHGGDSTRHHVCTRPRRESHEFMWTLDAVDGSVL